MSRISANLSTLNIQTDLMSGLHLYCRPSDDTTDQLGQLIMQCRQRHVPITCALGSRVWGLHSRPGQKTA